MEFANKKDKKFLQKIITNSIIRKSPYKNRNLIINYTPVQINVGKIKNSNDLLKYCGLAHEYKYKQCFVILASKLNDTFNFELTYAFVFCSLNWEIQEIKIIQPNQKITSTMKHEYVFVMPPNLIKYLDLKIGMSLRI